MKLAFTIFFIFVVAASCQQLKYNPDFGFMNSAQANSPEYLVYINEKVCKDMEGKIGLCAKRIKTNEIVNYKLNKRPYSYRLNVTCSSNVGFNLSVDVLSNAEFSFSIPPDNFKAIQSFTCMGEVFPHDRDQKVSAFWHTRFVVYDEKYRERESIVTVPGTLILGSHSRYVSIDGKNYSKKTKHKGKFKKVHTESEMMRMNYYGI